MNEMVNIKAKLAEDFSMKNLGLEKKILGMRISRERKEILKNITSRVRGECTEEV